MKKLSASTRPSPRQESIETRLRRQIITGRLSPGVRLPTRNAMLRKFDVSMTTLQRALDQLTDEGFVHAQGKRGTFVADRPPHLNRYGLMFYTNPGDESSWGRYWSLVDDQAAVLEHSGACEFKRYYDLGRPDSEDFQAAMRDVRAHRLAGLIFTSNPSYLNDTPIMDEADMPRVAMMAPVDIVPIPCVMIDGGQVYSRAIEYLAQRGRRRVAILLKAGPHGHRSTDQILQEAISAHQMTHHRYWRQYVDVFDAQSVCNATELLMHDGQAQRPDALIISDDTMLEAATAGLLAAGVRVPDDVEVVAQCNFPATSGGVLPMRRLGFDIRSLLRSCTQCIDQQRAGQTPQPLTVIPARFEEEIPMHAPADWPAGASSVTSHGLVSQHNS